MQLLLPLYLAVMNIAGDNIAVVPDIAAKTGPQIYYIIILAYMGFGILMSCVLAWIGFFSSRELMVTSRIFFGCRGKILLAILLLAVCIPASALTGGMFSGWALHYLTGIPYLLAVPLSLVFFGWLSVGNGEEFLKLSNYVALIVIPTVILMFFYIPIQLPPFSYSEFKTIDWLLVLAFTGYNTGGMHSVLLVETSSCLAKKNIKPIMVVILAKFIEGIFTIMIIFCVLNSESQGPLSFAKAAESSFGHIWIFYFVMFCIFTNYMAPALMLNARQLVILTGRKFEYCLVMIIALIYLFSFLPLEINLYIISIFGTFMIIYIVALFFVLYVNRIKRSGS